MYIITLREIIYIIYYKEYRIRLKIPQFYFYLDFFEELTNYINEEFKYFY